MTTLKQRDNDNAVTLLSATSLSQRCARFRCHSAVLVSPSQRCVHHCLSAVGFLLCTKIKGTYSVSSVPTQVPPIKKKVMVKDENSSCKITNSYSCSELS